VKLQKNQPKRFSLSCGGKTKELPKKKLKKPYEALPLLLDAFVLL